MLRFLDRPLSLLALFVLLGCLGGSTRVDASPEEGTDSVPHHTLVVRLDLKAHRLIAEDTLTLPASEGDATRDIVFDLAPTLKLKTIRVQGGALSSLPARGADGSFTLTLPSAATPGHVSLRGHHFRRCEESGRPDMGCGRQHHGRDQ